MPLWQRQEIQALSRQAPLTARASSGRRAVRVSGVAAALATARARAASHTIWGSGARFGQLRAGGWRWSVAVDERRCFSTSAASPDIRYVQLEPAAIRRGHRRARQVHRAREPVHQGWQGQEAPPVLENRLNHWLLLHRDKSNVTVRSWISAAGRRNEGSCVHQPRERACQADGRTMWPAAC